MCKFYLRRLQTLTYEILPHPVVNVCEKLSKVFHACYHSLYLPKKLLNLSSYAHHRLQLET